MEYPSEGNGEIPQNANSQIASSEHISVDKKF